MTIEDYISKGYTYGTQEGKEGNIVWAESPPPNEMSIMSHYKDEEGYETILLEILAKLKEAYTNKNHK